MRIIRLISVTLTFVACENASIKFIENEKIECTSTVIEKGLYYQLNGEEFLWAGEDSTTHFNITNWNLDECNLHNGLGRETFPALLSPKFTPIQNVINNYEDHERALVLVGADTIKVYPNNTLREYETVNDEIDGTNIIVVYCFLAELTAVYQTNYCGKDLTFGVSGFTYRDPDLNDSLESFILWDRETESLWWPISEESVSGYFKDEPLRKYKKETWEENTWLEIKTQYPSAFVLKSNQTMPIPINWVKAYPCD